MKIYKLVIALGMIGGAFNSTFSAYGDNPPVNPYQPDPNPIRQIAGYEYAWGDEFNVDGVVNPDLWQAEEGFIRGNELQYYRRENAVVKDGRLLITGKKERVKNKFYDASSGDYRKNTEYSEYTSASILGKDKRHFLLDVSKYVPEFIRQTGRFQLSGLAGTIRIGLVMVRLI